MSDISVVRDEQDRQVFVVKSEYEQEVVDYLNEVYGSEEVDDDPPYYFYAEPAWTLSNDDIAAIRAGKRKYEVAFWSEFENGRGKIGGVSSTMLVTFGQLPMNGPVSKTCALVWANNREEAIDLARKQLEEANVV